MWSVAPRQQPSRQPAGGRRRGHAVAVAILNMTIQNARNHHIYFEAAPTTC
jgi:hypothetical protein